MITNFLVSAEGRPIVVGVGMFTAIAQIHDNASGDAEHKRCSVVEDDAQGKIDETSRRFCCRVCCRSDGKFTFTALTNAQTLERSEREAHGTKMTTTKHFPIRTHLRRPCSRREAVTMRQEREQASSHATIDSRQKNMQYKFGHTTRPISSLYPYGSMRRAYKIR
jgi:hypothetical protein